jgi:hypothetical protein
MYHNMPTSGIRKNCLLKAGKLCNVIPTQGLQSKDDMNSIPAST